MYNSHIELEEVNPSSENVVPNKPNPMDFFFGFFLIIELKNNLFTLFSWGCSICPRNKTPRNFCVTSQYGMNKSFYSWLYSMKTNKVVEFKKLLLIEESKNLSLIVSKQRNNSLCGGA